MFDLCKLLPDILKSYRKPDMTMTCKVRYTYAKAILSKGHILLEYVHLWASYTKSWQLMAKCDKLMQSFSQIWAIFVKICPEMAMLCKVTASSA